MNTKKTILKILLTAIWLAVGSGLIVLLVAAIGKKNRQNCSDYTIKIKGNQNIFFVDANDVLKLLMTGTGGKIKGQPMNSFQLMKLENLLEQNVWIQDAELYFDNQDVLHVTVKEREPIARIFSKAGNSFYIDSNGVHMPLSDKLSARVPVFTNFPEKKFLTSKDSVLLNDVRKTAQFIINDPFWMAQVTQVDITPQQTFEMVPTIGNHLVRLGNSENIEQKFHRLFIFYQQVLSKSGFDKYSVVDVQYTGQVIGTKKGTTTVAIDSIQLRNNVQKLLNMAKQMQAAAIAEERLNTDKPIIKSDSVTNIPAKVVKQTAVKTVSKPLLSVRQPGNPNPRPTGSSGRASKTKTISNLKTEKQKIAERIPKAVMKKKEER
ncbi:MAG: cell division protein FtsQ/DivIB [Bacteroidota bacterium]|nr:cell division protein FtsQ/DivIB [Bacteroidota bacterium]